MEGFEDVLSGNETYARHYEPRGKSGWAERRLAVVTCIDSRIDPLAILGLVPGDAKILRNAGARVTDDVLRSLILATNLLGVQRICVVQHTDCQMAKATQDELAARISESTGAEAQGWDYLAIGDQERTVAEDVERITSCDLLKPGVSIAGFILELDTGRLRHVVVPQKA